MFHHVSAGDKWCVKKKKSCCFSSKQRFSGPDVVFCPQSSNPSPTCHFIGQISVEIDFWIWFNEAKVSNLFCKWMKKYSARAFKGGREHQKIWPLEEAAWPPKPPQLWPTSAEDKKTLWRRRRGGFISIFISLFSVKWQVVFFTAQCRNVQIRWGTTKLGAPSTHRRWSEGVGGGHADRFRWHKSQTVASVWPLGPRKGTSRGLIPQHHFESVSESLRREKQQVVMWVGGRWREVGGLLYLQST